MFKNVIYKMTAVLAGIAMLVTGTAAEAVRAETAADSARARAETSAEAARAETQAIEQTAETILLGDERADLYLPLLKGKRVALFSNQTGIVGNRIEGEQSGDQETDANAKDPSKTEKRQAAADKGTDPADRSTADRSGIGPADPDSSDTGADLIPFGKKPDGTDVVYGDHILDVLVRQDVNVTAVFSPEHGFRGTSDAGAHIDDSVDERTGVPVISLYGNRSKRPTEAELDLFDVLVVDIQDVGLRFYTYYISMYHLMDACAAAGKEVVILDRPNPNGFYVDGPILEDGFTSGVGLLPIPVVHGMTLGELAMMINGEGWLYTGPDSCRLTVVPCQNYTHKTLTSLAVRPSPNLKDMRAVYLYASTCLFENTAVSVGRGTDYPFEVYGSPCLQGMETYSFTFTPVSMPGAEAPPFEGQTCCGRDLRQIPLDRILQEKIDLRYLVGAYHAIREARPDISFFGTPDDAGRYWIDKLFGTDRIRHMIEEGYETEEIERSWQEDVETFKKQRQKYLLYE